MPRVLQTNEKALLDAASNAEICASLAHLAGGAATAWTRPGHPHADGCLPINYAALAAIPGASLVDSIAVLGPLHVVDGWGYLARAVSALASGSPHIARHLAYYAELRAALSILASEGVGVFNANTALVDAGGGVSFINNFPTHKIAWQALEYWASRQSSFKRMVGSVEIAGVSLYDAFTGFFSAPSSTQLASQLLNEWGFDVSVSADDGLDRNISSYNPNELINIATTSQEDFNSIWELWRCFEPKRYLLERHLLRILLESQMQILGSSSLAGRAKEYERLDPRLKSQVSKAFIERNEEADDPLLLALARGRHIPTMPREMIARAALLLRLALGMANSNLKAASVAPLQDLRFWWKPFGEQRGLWGPDSEPEFMHMLWEDVDYALSDAREASDAVRAAWFTSPTGSGLPRICETERICLWALCDP